ncbi:MAG: bifunctional phosphoribosylaminoimidazolecarboxamide formyltransferase/IMP cyclohydrolase [Alphaproteobacteria bacterium]|nr:bifunctional phosphoribosylaminoimidazolecarboxamide formyltransferase/IMP cyclohydrolase [Alphaproteobacteria bacterium]
MSNSKPRKIERALISVSDKNGVEDFAKKLAGYGVEILSTGGTAKMLKEAGLDVIDVSDFTGFPEIMNGRVKTLHPKVHGGLLAIRENADHVKAMEENGIQGIDMLVVNLYPFVETVKGGGDFAACVENIDIGGPAMIRAAAKNHDYLSVITTPQDYAQVLSDMQSNDGAVTHETRKKLAASAFALTAAYDSSVSSWFAQQLGEESPYAARYTLSGTLKQTLRYGENPHQSAALYMFDDQPRPGAASAQQLQGKELSYNNINDTDAAFELVAEFDAPAVAIIKHANPCGVASDENIMNAYERALRCDPVSAFGGIIALNRPFTKDLAEAIITRFVEVVIAPSVEDGALEVMAQKKNIRVLTTGSMPDVTQPRRMLTRIAGGILVQDTDNHVISAKGLQVVTAREPSPQELKDLLFAERVAKHVKSNAIVYAKDGATVGIGAGQMSRVDSARIAAWKAEEAAKEAGLSESLAKGSVVASDAFFPFADGLISAAEAGVSAVIQPGGSIRDEEVIAAANERGLAMVFTGTRHFRH